MSAVAIRDAFIAHRPAVFGWAFRVLGNREDALDATQDVFLKWWRAHRDNDVPENPVGWLRTVTINHSINLGKSRKRRSHSLDADATEIKLHKASAVDPEMVDAAERRRIASALAAALEEMSEQQRAVLFAKVYDGCTFAEIARQSKLALPTVKTHYLRALRVARRALTEAGIVAGTLQ